MKLLDANLLVYAANDQAPRHQTAKRAVERALSETETVVLPWAVLLAFLRLTTNPAVMAEPLDGTRALAYVRDWLGRGNVVTPQPTTRHPDLIEELVAATGTGGNLISDIHLAALAIEHGAVLWSSDNNFDRFPGLDWHNPLAEDG